MSAPSTQGPVVTGMYIQAELKDGNKVVGEKIVVQVKWGGKDRQIEFKIKNKASGQYQNLAALASSPELQEKIKRAVELLFSSTPTEGTTLGEQALAPTEQKQRALSALKKDIAVILAENLPITPQAEKSSELTALKKYNFERPPQTSGTAAMFTHSPPRKSSVSLSLTGVGPPAASSSAPPPPASPSAPPPPALTTTVSLIKKVAEKKFASKREFKIFFSTEAQDAF
ncbi:MAG: hypothetical protein WC371_03320, partial [Parachlamydiales bacterium]